MKYIETLREGERVSSIYLCKSRQTAMTKAGKAYENLILQDKTGTVDAKIWDPNSVKYQTGAKSTGGRVYTSRLPSG